MIPDFIPLLGFPIISFMLFRTLDRRDALIWSILAGYMFIPAGANFDFPLLPRIDKATLPVLSGLLFMWVSRPTGMQTDPEALPSLLPKNLLFRALIFALIGGAFLTVATNMDPLRYGSLTLPGMRLYDGFSQVLTTIMLILPMLAARKYLFDDRGHEAILKAMMVAGLIYTLPIIFELVMSPQLNRMIYGYFPHNWAHHVRPGGYRPLVFLQHGLMLAIFMSCCALAAFGLAKCSPPNKKSARLGLAALLLLVVASLNSLGALAILVALIPVMLLLNVRKQVLIGAIIASSILVYPALRGAGLVPTDMVVDLASKVHEDRAASIYFRFLNEDTLLEKANERELFGWGIWGRARVYSASGQDISVTDGWWVIQIGEAGWIGYIGLFGLLCLPAIVMGLRARKLDVTQATSALCLVLVANIIDLIPNAGLSPVTWMLAGALIGRLEHRTSSAPQADAVPIRDETIMASGYTRFPRTDTARAHLQPSRRHTRRRNTVTTGRRADGS